MQVASHRLRECRHCAAVSATGTISVIVARPDGTNSSGVGRTPEAERFANCCAYAPFLSAFSCPTTGRLPSGHCDAAAQGAAGTTTLRTLGLYKRNQLLA